MNPLEERELLSRVNCLPLDFILSGAPRVCRRWTDRLLYDSEVGEGWRVLLRKTYWEIFGYNEAYWELIASDAGNGGFSEPREAPIIALAIIPVPHMRIEEDRLVYVSPESGEEQELHATRCIRFSSLLRDGESIGDQPDILIKRAIQKILPEGITFEFNRLK